MLLLLIVRTRSSFFAGAIIGLLASTLVAPLARADVMVEDYAVYHRAARRYMVEEKWNLAVEQLEKAIAAKNDDDTVWTDLGDALSVDPRGVHFGSATQNARAAEAYRRATQLNPASARAWNNLAWLLAKTKTSLDEALAAAKRAVEVDDTRAGYLDTLAEVYFARGDVDDAIATEDKARSLEPDDGYLEKQYERFLQASSGPSEAASATATPTPRRKTTASLRKNAKHPKKGKTK